MQGAKRLGTADAWQFVEAFAGLDPRDWQCITIRESTDRAAAVSELATLVRRRRASLIAWSLEDGVDTVRWLRGVRGPSPVLEAVRVAALAILLRSDLEERRFRVLCQPFEKTLPIAGLAGSLRNLCAPDGSAKSTFEKRLAFRT